VVDASVAVQWFAREPGSEIAAMLVEGVYIVLAEARGAPLATSDESLRTAARARGLRIWRP
jgi:predicted nucleic acid-binding protein